MAQDHCLIGHPDWERSVCCFGTIYSAGEFRVMDTVIYHPMMEICGAFNDIKNLDSVRIITDQRPVVKKDKDGWIITFKPLKRKGKP